MSHAPPSTPPGPHPESPRLLRAMRKCGPYDIPWYGDAYRAAALERKNEADLLSGEVSRLYGQRWNPPVLFRTVYLSLAQDTAGEEYLAQNRLQGLPDSEGLPYVMTAARVNLVRVLDLTNIRVRYKK